MGGGRGGGGSKGEEGLKAKVLKGKYEPKLKFPKRWGSCIRTNYLPWDG